MEPKPAAAAGRRPARLTRHDHPPPSPPPAGTPTSAGADDGTPPPPPVEQEAAAAGAADEAKSAGAANTTPHPARRAGGRQRAQAAPVASDEESGAVATSSNDLAYEDDASDGDWGAGDSASQGTSEDISGAASDADEKAEARRKRKAARSKACKVGEGGSNSPSGGGGRRCQQRWTPEEDAALLALMKEHGTDWKAIEGCMTGRTSKKCRERYVNHLQPGIKKGHWSLEDEYAVALCHAAVGTSWRHYVHRLPERTENSLKNYFHSCERSKSEAKKSCLLSLYVAAVKTSSPAAALSAAVKQTADLPKHLEAAQARTIEQWEAAIRDEADELAVTAAAAAAAAAAAKPSSPRPAAATTAAAAAATSPRPASKLKPRRLQAPATPTKDPTPTTPSAQPQPPSPLALAAAPAIAASPASGVIISRLSAALAGLAARPGVAASAGSAGAKPRAPQPQRLSVAGAAAASAADLAAGRAPLPASMLELLAGGTESGSGQGGQAACMAPGWTRQQVVSAAAAAAVASAMPPSAVLLPPPPAAADMKPRTPSRKRAAGSGSGGGSTTKRGGHHDAINNAAHTAPAPADLFAGRSSAVVNNQAHGPAPRPGAPPSALLATPLALPVSPVLPPTPGVLTVAAAVAAMAAAAATPLPVVPRRARTKSPHGTTQPHGRRQPGPPSSLASPLAAAPASRQLIMLSSGSLDSRGELLAAAAAQRGGGAPRPSVDSLAELQALLLGEPLRRSHSLGSAELPIDLHDSVHDFAEAAQRLPPSLSPAAAYSPCLPPAAAAGVEVQQHNRGATTRHGGYASPFSNLPVLGTADAAMLAAWPVPPASPGAGLLPLFSAPAAGNKRRRSSGGGEQLLIAELDLGHDTSVGTMDTLLASAARPAKLPRLSRSGSQPLLQPGVPLTGVLAHDATGLRLRWSSASSGGGGGSSCSDLLEILTE